MIQTRCRFGFQTKSPEMGFAGPAAGSDNFQSHRAVQAFLSGAINYRLATTADFLQQLIVIKIRVKVRPDEFSSVVVFAIERSECRLEQAQAAKPVRRV